MSAVKCERLYELFLFPNVIVGVMRGGREGGDSLTDAGSACLGSRQPCKWLQAFRRQVAGEPRSLPSQQAGRQCQGSHFLIICPSEWPDATGHKLGAATSGGLAVRVSFSLLGGEQS